MTRDEAYEALGLAPGASQDDLRDAFHEAAFWSHPDRNPGNRVAEAFFKRVSKAYQLLREELSRDAEEEARRRAARAKEESAERAAAVRRAADRDAAKKAAAERAAAERVAAERAAAEKAAAEKAAAEKAAAQRRTAPGWAAEERGRLRAAAARRAHCARCGKFRELVVADSIRRVCEGCLKAENVPDSVVRADLMRLPAKLKELKEFAYDPRNFHQPEPLNWVEVEGDGGIAAFCDDEEYWFWEIAPGNWAQADVVGGERKLIRSGYPTKEKVMQFPRSADKALRKVISWRWVEGYTPGLGKVYVTHDWRALVAQGKRKGWSLRKPWSLFIILNGQLGLAREDFPTAEAAMNFSG